MKCIVVVILLLLTTCSTAAPPVIQPTQAVINPVTAATTSATATATATAAPTASQVPPAKIVPSLTASPTAASTAAPVMIPTAPSGALSPNGPWLVTRQVRPVGEGGRQVDLILLNQDGSGGAQIRAADCQRSTQIEAHSDNRLVTLGGETYLLNPRLGLALTINSWRGGCGEYASLGAQEGRLAMVYQAGEDRPPELRVYQLPQGALLNAFPLLRCVPAQEACRPDLLAWLPAWDDSGRSLAFPVVLPDGASGLFIYDTQRRQARQIARLEGSIFNLDWSPDGQRIVLGLSPHDDSGFVSTLWAVMVSDGQSRLLDTLDPPYPQEIVTWLDNDRFLVVGGSLRSAATEGAYNLRLVNISTGEVKLLFDDGLNALEIDRQSETVALYVLSYSSHSEYGFYLVSIADGLPRFIGPPTGNLITWRADIGLFITDQACPGGVEEYQGFDPQGHWRCARLPADAAGTQPGPDEQWQAILRDGLWVQRSGSAPVLAYPVTPNLVIWQPDSRGLFFSAKGALHHLSLPDLTVWDLGLPFSDPGEAEWVGGK